MAEYLKREALLTDICDDMCGLKYTGVCENCRVVALIADTPAADVAPVVRCKDCTHLYGTLCTACGLMPRKPDDFCSLGERKDGADSDTDGSI